jgi:DNA-directed RNA polymerase I, II, and III subunit RPABC1
VINQGKLYFLPKKNYYLFWFLFSENKPARSQLIVMVAHNDDPTDTMIVQFPDQPKIGVDRIKDYFKKMQEESIPHSILVVQTGLTPAAREVNNSYF